MNVYNTTEDVVETKFHNFIHIIGPGEVKAFSDDAGRFIVSKYGCYGLIGLEYGDKEEKKYGTLTAYKKAVRLEGLKKYKEWNEHCLRQEKPFKTEVNQKSGGDVELHTTQIPYFESKIKEVGLLIEKEVLPEKKEEVKSTLPDKAPTVKRRGRPARKTLNVNSSGTQNANAPVS